MSLFSEIKKNCRDYQIKPLRRRGQNFLISRKIIERVIETADLKASDIVLEIGAGSGFLTREIAARAKKVMAVEIDRKLLEILRENLSDYKNVEVIQEDIRKFQISKLKFKDYKIIGNIPFNITGMVLRKFLGETPKPESMVLILQKEVAERITARPPKMNLLALAVQFYGRAERASRISRNNFWPKPHVDSAILKIVPFGRARDVHEEQFFKTVRAGFSQPRKYLLNNLAKSAIISKEKGEKILGQLNLNPKVRAQELALDDWIKITKLICHVSKT